MMILTLLLSYSLGLHAYDYNDLKWQRGATACRAHVDLEEFVLKYNQQKVVHSLRAQIFTESAKAYGKLQSSAKKLAITNTSTMIIAGVGLAAIGSSVKAGGLAIFKGAKFIFPTKTFLKAAPLVVGSDMVKVYLVVRYSTNGALVGMKLFNNLSQEQIEKFQEERLEIYAIEKEQILDNLKHFEARIQNYKTLLYSQIDDLEKKKLEDSYLMRLKTAGWSTYANMKIDRTIALSLAEIHSEISAVYETLQRQLEDLCSAEAN